MYNQMLCGNTQAEIDNDHDTEHCERTRYAFEESKWIRIVNELLEGKTVNECGKSANLAEYLADKYVEFSALVDNDYDYMAVFISGKMCVHTAEIIKREARTLASIIVG